jgi:hypothetical protein
MALDLHVLAVACLCCCGLSDKLGFQAGAQPKYWVQVLASSRAKVQLPGGMNCGCGCVAVVCFSGMCIVRPNTPPPVTSPSMLAHPQAICVMTLLQGNRAVHNTPVLRG